MQTVQTTDGRNGGEFQGPSHAGGGIKTVVVEDGRPIEVEGGETILNKRSMASQEVVTCSGTPKQIASTLNELEGGVSFASGATCTTVKNMAAKGLYINNKRNSTSSINLNTMNKKTTFAQDGYSISKGNASVYNFQYADGSGITASGVVRYNPTINEFDVDIEDSENVNILNTEPTGASYKQISGVVLDDFQPHLDEHYNNTQMAWGGFLTASRKENLADNKKVVQERVKDFSLNMHNLREDYRSGELTGQEYANSKSQLISQYNPYLLQAKSYDIALNPADLMISGALKEHAGYVKQTGGYARDGASIPQVPVIDERARLKYEAHEMAKLFKITSRRDPDYPSWYGKVVDIENYIRDNKDLIDNYNITDSWQTSLFKFRLVANPASNSEEMELAARGKIVKSTDVNKRSSPSVNATNYPAGHTMEGNDGNLWQTHLDSKGIQNWVKMEEDSTDTAADGLWIKNSIQHPGIVRTKAKQMGLIHGDQTLSETDLEKIEQLGGKWPKRVQLARTLKSFHNEKAESGSDINPKPNTGSIPSEYNPVINWINYEKDNWKTDYKLKTYFIIKFDSVEKQRPYKIFSTNKNEPAPSSNNQEIQPVWFANFLSVEEAKAFFNERMNIQKAECGCEIETASNGTEIKKYKWVKTPIETIKKGDIVSIPDELLGEGKIDMPFEVTEIRPDKFKPDFIILKGVGGNDVLKRKIGNDVMLRINNELFLRDSKNIQETNYGTIEKGLSFFAPDPRFNFTKSRRIDEYTSKTTDEKNKDSIMCIDENDLSDQFERGQNGEYNSNCYGCWNGSGHTINKHNSASKEESGLESNIETASDGKNINDIEIGDNVHIPSINKSGIVMNIIPEINESYLVKFVSGESSAFKRNDIEKIIEITENGTDITKKNTYSVTVDYQSTSGNPITVSSYFTAEKAEDAIKILEDKVKQRNNFFKIYGGSAVEIAENGTDVKVSTGVFGSDEFWRVTSKSIGDIGIFPKQFNTSEQAKEKFKAKYNIKAEDGIEVEEYDNTIAGAEKSSGNFKYKVGDIVYVFQHHSDPRTSPTLSIRRDKEELEKYLSVAPKYIVGTDNSIQKWSKVEIIEPWQNESGWESYKVKQLDGYRKEDIFIAAQNQMSPDNSVPIAIGYMKNGGPINIKEGVYIDANENKFVLIDTRTNALWANEYFKTPQDAEAFAAHNKLIVIENPHAS